MRHLVWHVQTWLILCVGMSSLTTCTALGDDDSATTARAAAIGSGNNLKSFTSFRALFKRTQGSAKSIDDIRTGKYSVNMVCEYSILVDGSLIRAERLGKKWSEVQNKPKAAKIRGGLSRTVINYCQVTTYLTNGTEDLNYDHSGTANIYKPDLPRPPGDFHPLGMGMFGPYLRLSPEVMAAKPEQYTVTGGQVRQIEGRPLIECQFTGSPHGRNLLWEFAFDPTRGFLPARMKRLGERTKVGESGPPDLEVWLLDARECGSGRFFPTRYVIFMYPRESHLPFWVTEVQVTELSPDYKPTREDMTITLPGGTDVIFFRPNESPLATLKQDEPIHPSDLPKLFEITEVISNNRFADTAVPRTSSIDWRFLLVGATGIGLVGLLAWRYFIRGRASLQGQP